MYIICSRATKFFEVSVTFLEIASPCSESIMPSNCCCINACNSYTTGIIPAETAAPRLMFASYHSCDAENSTSELLLKNCVNSRVD